MKPKIVLRSRLPIVWMVFLMGAALFMPSRVWTTLLVGLGGLIAASYLWVYLLSRGVSASRKLRFGWVSVGDRLSERFEIRNQTGLPVLWAEIVDESTVPSYRPAVVRSVPARATDSWRQSAVCLRRGQFSLGPWSLRSSDPFGLFSLIIPYPATEEIIIHPPIHVRIPIQLPTGESAGRIRGRVRSWQATISASGVRNYEPQDPLHWIHWPTSARRDELSSRLFDLDAAGDIWLILDMQEDVQLGSEAAGTEEHAVLLAAALSSQALRQFRAVGLAAYGREPQVIPPGRGHGQQWKILRSLALIRADGPNDLSSSLQDLRRIGSKGSTAVIITPSGSTAWLPDLHHLSTWGIRCSVVLLDRFSFSEPEDTLIESSQGLRDSIQSLGLPCHMISQGEVGVPAVELERRGYWEFKVTGTGKVVTTRSPLGRVGRTAP